MTKALALIAVATSALTLAACGGGTDADDGQGAQVLNEPDVRWTEQQILDALHEQNVRYGDEIESGADDCWVAVIMLTQEEVELYTSAGDTVVTTPDGTAGVKVTGASDPNCLAKVETGMGSLK